VASYVVAGRARPALRRRVLIVRVLVRSAAAVAMTAAAGLAWTPPAAAAACSDDAGVTVVVDYARSGGSGVSVGCIAGGGGASAASLFGDAGHDLERVSSQPGAVCKVDGLRTQDACQRMPPADAFWGLFWSDGDGGWVFSQEGVDNLNVPAGGSVAWAWQNGGGYDYPSVAPTTHEEEPAPEPSQPPSGGGGGGSAGGGTTPGGSTGTPDGATGSPSASPTAGGDASGKRRDRGDDDRGGDDRGKQQADDTKKQQRDRDRDPSEEPGSSATPGSEESADPSGSTTAAEPPAGAGDEGLPVWVGPSAAGGALGIAGLAAYLRRRAA
jgi:hypothetical protein